jgi:hypothetical protein
MSSYTWRGSKARGKASATAIFKPKSMRQVDAALKFSFEEPFAEFGRGCHAHPALGDGAVALLAFDDREVNAHDLVAAYYT